MADPITSSVVGIAGSVLNKFVADKNLKMKLEHELKTQLQTANLAQIEVNKIEAASKNWFVAGWRPSVGWVCSFAMAYHFIIAPMVQFGIGIWGIQVELPEFDFSQLSTILMAMLGMAGLRTFEKQKKVAKGDD
tara:strand:+ start:1151 stop:1552 length:402 start_codon:yes stop_codon:yes gene_type:complete